METPATTRKPADVSAAGTSAAPVAETSENETGAMQTDAEAKAETTASRQISFDLSAFFAGLQKQAEKTAAESPTLFDLGAFFSRLAERPAATETAGTATGTQTQPRTAPAVPPTTGKPALLSFPIQYEDAGVNITITKQWYLNTWCYVAHIRMSDYGRLHTGMARDAYGYDELPASFAGRHDSLLLVNGDYAEGDGKSVLRAGRIVGSGAAVVQAVYSGYTGRLSPCGGETLSALAEMGYTESFGFGAGELVVDGKSVYLRKDGGKSTQRTLIGATGVPGEIYIVVTEGRYCDGVSRGLQYYEAGDFLESLGCSYGIALDGGICSAMVWDGTVLTRNRPQKTTGFVYITKK